MAYLAFRGSGAVNGVSRLHGRVSRRIFQSFFPRWPPPEVPVGHVTNGVHTPSWDSIEADALWTKACGADRWRGTMDTIEQDLAGVADAELWAMRTSARKTLVSYARERVAPQLASMVMEPDQAALMCRCLDPDTLTIGFARRFATYKRPGMLLHDPDRLVRILTNRDRPVQLVIAGKAHPADQAGQEMIKAWIDTPRRPWEASGTSGMKVLVDGGLNLSELDGWPGFDRKAAIRPGANAGRAPLGLIAADRERFDWGDDRRPRHEASAVIYELHVRGFTAHPSSGVPAERRGTFAGLIDRIPYLLDLGVTVVELMPVFQFDPGEGNYWGYNPISFFAPHTTYAHRCEMCDQHTEFRELVRAFHAAGLEVVLDVVYNHTGEGNHAGPMYSFKGLDNDTYYILSGRPDAPYADFSGTGNSLNSEHRYVRRMILDSLRYWARDMRVDGFRFDLASVFARQPDGSLSYGDPPIFGDIASDPGLAGLRLIAEPWDAAGAYQLGRAFPGVAWAQWNGRFRDDLRRFVRGDAGMVPALMRRLYGSDDLFPDDRASAYHAKHRRDGQRPQQQLRLGGRRGRSAGGDRPAQAPGEELPVPAPARERHANAPRWRRIPPHAGRQQQPLQPGQRDELAGLAIARRAPGHLPVRASDDRLSQGPSVALSKPLLARRHSLVRRGAAGGSLARFAQPRLLPARGLPGRRRRLRHGQRVLGGTRLHRAGRSAWAVVPGRRHGARESGRYPRAGPGSAADLRALLREAAVGGGPRAAAALLRPPVSREET